MRQSTSQPDGGLGLKDFRNYVIQQLTENVKEEDGEASKEEGQKQFNLSDILADDPSFYVKFHYFLYRDVDPSDERHTDPSCRVR